MNPVIVGVISELLRQGLPLGFDLLRLFSERDQLTKEQWDVKFLELQSKHIKKAEDYLAEARSSGRSTLTR